MKKTTYNDAVLEFRVFFDNHDICITNIIIQRISDYELLYLLPRYEYFRDGDFDEKERIEIFDRIFTKFKKECVPAWATVNYKII